VLDLMSLGDIAHGPTVNLPEGLRKLADIAIALALKPRLLLLDEPTSGVSAAEKFALMDTIVGVLRAEKVTALFVEHDMDVVERYADRVLVWDAGKVIAGGPPQEILRSSHVLERVIGIG
jgi:branched-chain amino acid transport system ATP-binding protein